MRIKNRHFLPDGSGHVTLIPEYEEDLFFLYNLIVTGDVLKCKSHRKVQKTTETSVRSERRLVMIQMLVTKIEYF